MCHLPNLGTNWLVLGTCQHSSTKSSGKSVSTSSIGVESEEEDTVFKSQHKQDKKLNAQSSQIKDLHSKLDGAIAENSQIWELLNPTTLQMAFTNALQAAQSGASKSGSHNSRQGKPFLGKPREPQLTAGKDRSIDPDKSCNYCKDMGYNLGNCLHLQKQKAFLAHQHQTGGGLN